ncbi:hypothetical protein HFD88_008602 [Aspergillus terreus]|nr:hypothetical protein HFD88_008602 [Aspergillus terreus]
MIQQEIMSLMPGAPVKGPPCQQLLKVLTADTVKWVVWERYSTVPATANVAVAINLLKSLVNDEANTNLSIAVIVPYADQRVLQGFITCCDLLEEARENGEPLEVCIEEISTKFHGVLTLRLFHGAKEHTGNPARKAAIINNRADLMEELCPLDPTDPASARVVVVSS